MPPPGWDTGQTERQSTPPGSAPPVYTERAQNTGAPHQINEIPPDLSLRLTNLKLTAPPDGQVESADLCIAHLKLLEAFYTLRNDIANTDNLFGIAGPTHDNAAGEKMITLREKRWQVYVSRAVGRFETWWQRCVPMSRGGGPGKMPTCYELENVAALRDAYLLGKPDGLPRELRIVPLDILMVWHAYMLNPRCFYEDCLRYGKNDFYSTNFPFQTLDGYISISTFDYSPPDDLQRQFEARTGLRWNNLEGYDDNIFLCPYCKKNVVVPWTRGSGFAASDEFLPGTGYADSNFSQPCDCCKTQITHTYLRTQKFRTDLELLLQSDVPFPGTILNINGRIEETSFKAKKLAALSISRNLFINVLVKKDGIPTPLASNLLKATEPARSDCRLDDIKMLFEKELQKFGILAKNKRGERIAFRRMMDKYWFNSSPFGIELVGAVIRQGSFTEKMHQISWLNSPALQPTMERLLVRYDRFIKLSKENPKLCVPTLDIDLGWHTHQLCPRSYHAYTTQQTQTLLDHDDKIEEGRLSNAFAQTSELYQARYGEPYSECNCWYCAAIRESHTRPLDSVFHRRKRSALAKIDAAHPVDPASSPHISAHNAVRDRDPEAQARLKVQAAKLDCEFRAAQARATKSKRAVPQREQYFYPYVYGYPYAMPYYYPFYVDPGMGGGQAVYAQDPCGVDSSPGMYGACAAGTCGAAIAAAGMCGAGGANGSCGGSGGCGSCGGGGGCGGGGAGGCGGGGGGCGGGGGGGGCGGGG